MSGTFDISDLLAKYDKLAVLTNTDMRELITQQATLFVFNSGNTPGVINITPPFSKAAQGNDGRAAGRQSIDRDLSRIFAPVTIKGTRTINHLFGDKDPQGVGRKPPYVVKTVELYPDVQGVYDYRNSRRKAGDRGPLTRGKLTGSNKSAYYVDAKKLSVVRNKLHARVGWAVACWWNAARAAGLNPRGVPGWIKEHTAAPGAASVQISDTAFIISLSSDLNYNGAIDMDRLAAIAMGYRKNATERRLPYVVRAVAKRLQMAA